MIADQLSDRKFSELSNLEYTYKNPLLLYDTLFRGFEFYLSTATNSATLELLICSSQRHTACGYA